MGGFLLTNFLRAFKTSKLCNYDRFLNLGEYLCTKCEHYFTQDQSECYFFLNQTNRSLNIHKLPKCNAVE